MTTFAKRPQVTRQEDSSELVWGCVREGRIAFWEMWLGPLSVQVLDAFGVIGLTGIQCTGHRAQLRSLGVTSWKMYFWKVYFLEHFQDASTPSTFLKICSRMLDAGTYKAEGLPGSGHGVSELERSQETKR